MEMSGRSFKIKVAKEKAWYTELELSGRIQIGHTVSGLFLFPRKNWSSHPHPQVSRIGLSKSAMVLEMHLGKAKVSAQMTVSPCSVTPTNSPLLSGFVKRAPGCQKPVLSLTLLELLHLKIQNGSPAPSK